MDRIFMHKALKLIVFPVVFSFIFFGCPIPEIDACHPNDSKASSKSPEKNVSDATKDCKQKGTCPSKDSKRDSSKKNTCDPKTHDCGALSKPSKSSCDPSKQNCGDLSQSSNSAAHEQKVAAIKQLEEEYERRLKEAKASITQWYENARQQIMDAYNQAIGKDPNKVSSKDTSKTPTGQQDPTPGTSPNSSGQTPNSQNTDQNQDQGSAPQIKVYAISSDPNADPAALIPLPFMNSSGGYAQIYPIGPESTNNFAMVQATDADGQPVVENGQPVMVPELSFDGKQMRMHYDIGDYPADTANQLAFAGFMLSYDDIINTANDIETGDLSNVTALQFGLKSDSESVQIQIKDADDKLVTFKPDDIVPGVLQVYTIPVSELANEGLSLNRIVYISFIVGGANQDGILEVNLTPLVPAQTQ